MTKDLNGVRCCGRDIDPELDPWYTGSIGRVFAVWECNDCGAKAMQAVGWIEPSEAEIQEHAEMES